MYVNRPFNCLLGILSMVVSGLVVVEISSRFSIKTEVAIIASLPVVLTAYGICARPTRYEDLKMYTKRSWWEYPIIYFFLPLSVVVVAFLLFLKYRGAI